MNDGGDESDTNGSNIHKLHNSGFTKITHERRDSISFLEYINDDFPEYITICFAFCGGDGGVHNHICSGLHNNILVWSLQSYFSEVYNVTPPN